MGQTCLPRVGPDLTLPFARLVATIPIFVAKRFAGPPQAEVLGVRNNNIADFVTHITGSRTARREH